MSSPDLFVVCKNCQAEVSPYVTECPYCGTRLRKRAPKIEREGGEPKPSKPQRERFARSKTRPVKQPRAPKPSKPPRLGKLRTGEIPGIRADEFGRPWGAFLLVFLATGFWLTAAFTVRADLALTTFDSDPWRYVTASFFNIGLVAQLMAVLGLGLFGWLLERRHGTLVMLLVWAICGPGALAVALELDSEILVFGSHGAALGLLAAWAIPVLLARRHNDGDDDADMMGVGVIAAVLILIPVVDQGSAEAAIIGGAAGALIGLVLSAAKPRT